MTSEEVDPELQVEDLILVVDVANIRPRTYAHRERFFQKISSKFRKAPPQEKRTTLLYIDECLAGLAAAAPGAVIMKYADYALADYLPDEDLPELDRRSRLDSYDDDRIFIIETAQADVPLLAAVNRVGGCVVSNDNFQSRELRKWITPKTRIIKQVYSDEFNAFSFRMPDGRDLNDWWSEINGFATQDWLESDDYLDIENRLRSRVKEATFEWIDERLTFVPEVPTDIERVLQVAEPFATRVDAYTEPEIYSEPELVFAEEIDRLRDLVGQPVALVGKLVVVKELIAITWSMQSIPIELTNPPEFARKDWRGYVRVRGLLTERDGILTLQVQKNSSYDSFNFAALTDLYLGRSSFTQLPRESSSNVRWYFPSFQRTMRVLKQLRDPEVLNIPVVDLDLVENEVAPPVGEDETPPIGIAIDSSSISVSQETDPQRPVIKLPGNEVREENPFNKRLLDAPETKHGAVGHIGEQGTAEVVGSLSGSGIDPKVKTSRDESNDQSQGLVSRSRVPVVAAITVTLSVLSAVLAWFLL